MKFYIMDAFTDELFGGNPAGVVFLDEGSDFPTDELMRKTAAELRYSETAFVRRLAADRFQTRYFTPEAEVELCGHATIGAFSALKLAGMTKPGSSYTNVTLAGELNIEVSEKLIFMDMSAPVFIGGIEGEAEQRELYGIMGLSSRSSAAGLKPEIISTGLPDILLPVDGADELERIAPDFPALAALSKKYGVVGVHAFTREADGVHCRNFAPLYGIDEEAATGTSNGALTYYLYRHGLLTPGAENVFIQGEKMNRPSAIISRLTDDGAVRIQIGGGAVMLAKGEIMLWYSKST